MDFFFFFFWFFGPEACGNLAFQPGMEALLPALDDEVLTPGQPGKSLLIYFTSSLNFL